MADDLIAVALDLARLTQGKSNQAMLKRAISTAYYAVFHAVSYECVEYTVGWGVPPGQYWDVVTPIYRSIDHSNARKIFAQISKDQGSTAELRLIGLAFVELQVDRILADYDPQPRFTQKDAVQRVDLAASVIKSLQALPADTRRLLAVQLITKQR